MLKRLRANGKRIIITQIVIIASLVLAINSIVWLSDAINKTANNYATTQYTVVFTK